MKAYCLASSSLGNCYILEFEIKGSPTKIMIECGLPLREIYNRAMENKVSLEGIKQCLITHAHSDHCKAAKDLSLRGVQIFATKPTLALLNIKGEELVELQPKNLCEGIKVMAFKVEHDIDGAVGFVIKTPTECVIFVNDHKRWTDNLHGFKPDYVFIECNYFHKTVYAQLHELQKLIDYGVLTDAELKDAKIKVNQHTRNLNAHCSLHGTIKGLEKLNLTNCKAIFLMHLSDRHANEYQMKQEVQTKMGILTYVCKKGGGIK